MVLNADVFSWGRNIEGQLGNNTTDSTFTSAATAYPVGDMGASDYFDILNAGERTEIVRGVDVTIPTSAARWITNPTLLFPSSSDDLWEITDDGKLHWNGSSRSGTQNGKLESAFRPHAYRWTAWDYSIQIDFDLLQFTQPSSSINHATLSLWGTLPDNSSYHYSQIRIEQDNLGNIYYRAFGSTSVNTTYATTDTSGKFKIEHKDGVTYGYVWNETAQQWEWNGSTAGFTFSEEHQAPKVLLQVLQSPDSFVEVEFDNFIVVGQPPDGNTTSDIERDTPGFAYWPQPQSAQGGISNPFLEFSGDTPGTTANDIQRQYRTYDGSKDTIHPLLEGASAPFYTVNADGNLRFDAIAVNPNGARDLHPQIVFEDDWEIIWVANIINGPNTCCWSVRLSALQMDDAVGTPTTFEVEYGYSGARRYRVWAYDLGGGWVNGASRTDAQVRIKMSYSNRTYRYWAWYNGIWNLQHTFVTSLSPKTPHFFTWRYSNWSVFPGFIADLESLTIVPSGTPDGSFYWADAPMVPSPSGYTDEAAITVGEPNFIDMVGGRNHAIGLKEDGSAHAWGSNEFGQLGDGTLVNKSSPVSVQGNHSFAELAPASDHNIGIKEDGTIYTWGRNDFGQLGFSAPSDATEEDLQDLGYPCDEYTLTELPWMFDGNISGVGQVLERATGTIFTWGSGVLGNHGQGLGFGGVNTSNPSSVLGGHNWTGMGLGSNHMIGITADGDVYGWGNNSYGQLGTGNHTGYDVPQQALALPGGIKAMHPDTTWMCRGCNKHGLACGGDEFSLFIGEDKQVYGMGRNSNVRGGVLGNGTYTDRSSPVSAMIGRPFGEIACGESASYGIAWSWDQGIEESTDWGRGAQVLLGQVFATGQNTYGELGDGTTTSKNSPVPVGLYPNTYYASRIGAGSGFACGLASNAGGSLEKPSGLISCWGRNFYGQLGDGTTTNKSSPVSVYGFKTFTDFSCGSNHVCAIDANDGSMWCWGRGTWGQLGTGAYNISNSSPVSVLGNRSYISVGVIANSSCGMLENGDIYCWGRGSLSGISTSYNSPVLIPAISPARVPASPRFIVDTADYLNCDETKVYSPVDVGQLFVTAATGLDHSLAIDRNFQVWAWGRNDAGQLGLGDTTDRSTPTLVSGLPNENFVKVAGGRKHSCAITELGDVWCWGDNTYNQAGPSGGGLYAEAYGLLHNLGSGARQSGWIENELPWVVGDNNIGELGDGTTTLRPLSSPVTIYNSYPTQYKPKWLKIAITTDLAAGIRLGNDEIPTQLFAWGENDDGSLGNNIPPIGGDRSTPVTMTQLGLPGVPVGNMPKRYFVDIGVGGDMFGCALRATGDVWCWGRNTVGQLGQGYFGLPNKSSAVSVLNTGQGGYIFRHISIGQDHVLAIDTGGKIWAWGSGAQGKLGYGGTTSRNSPVSALVPLGSFIHISAGLRASGGVKRGHGASPDEDQYPDVHGGTGWCWGGSLYGVLGNGTWTPDVNSPVSVLGNHVFTKLEVGDNHVCALDHTGHPWCWGRQSGGELGIGAASPTSRNSPVSCFGGPFSFIDIKTGNGWTIAVEEGGALYTWGTANWFVNSNSPVKTILTQGQPSFEFQSLTPQLISGGPFIDIDCGGEHSMTLDNSNRAWGWGRNNQGQLGDNSLTDRETPVSVYGNHKFVDISAGENHTFAMKADGTICTWGAGNWGKLLWHTDENPRSTPTCGVIEGIACVPFLPNTGNYAHSTYMECGSQFIAWTWGCNTDGKLGDGTITNRSTPVQVIGNKKWIDMSGGGNFTIAIDTDGRIHAWGDDSKGQLGDG
jgi:alpha-tubulin suppressor-like RCC1 family protein